MFLVKSKGTGWVVRVYGVVRDAHGYPHFVVYSGNQWMTVSAKHFEPMDDNGQYKG